MRLRDRSLRLIRLNLRGCAVGLLLAVAAVALVGLSVRAYRARTPPALTAPAEVAVEAVAAQSDPAKLATLGPRGANPRLKRIVFYLAQARDAGVAPESVIASAQRRNGSAGTPRAPLVAQGLLRNLKIADGLGLLTPENREGLRRGNAPTVTRGPYAAEIAEVDHVVPRAVAPELDCELANLEMLPATLNRRKSDRVGERQLDYARRFRAAGLLSAQGFGRVQAAFRPAGTAGMEVTVP